MSTTLVVLCSGPGAMAVIAANLVKSQFCAALCGLVMLRLGWDVLRGGRSQGVFLAATLLVLFHPVWMVSGIHGDCGILKYHLSVGFAAASLGLLVLRYGVALSSRQRSDIGVTS